MGDDWVTGVVVASGVVVALVAIVWVWTLLQVAKVLDDPSIDTTSRTGKLVMGILALIAEFENDIRRERQMDGIKKARERGVRFGRKPLLVVETIKQVKNLRRTGKTVPEIMHQMNLSKASVYRALGPSKAAWGA